MTNASGARRPDPITYMAAVAATDPGRAYKQLMLTALDLRSGLTALDLGCGPAPISATSLPVSAPLAGCSG